MFLDVLFHYDMIYYNILLSTVVRFSGLGKMMIIITSHRVMQKEIYMYI